MIDLHFHPFRKALMLSLNEMAVLKEIYDLSNNTKYNGWCSKSKANIAETLDLSRQSIQTIISTLLQKNYVEKDKNGWLRPTDEIREYAQERKNIGFIISADNYSIATARFKEIKNKYDMTCKETLQGVKKLDTEPVKKLDTGCKETLHEGVKKLDISISLSKSLSNITPIPLLGEFDNFRKLYPGTKRGNETEFTNFIKKHEDWKVVLNYLLPALNKQIAWRKEAGLTQQFVPQWANLQTWINQRRWEEEMGKIAIQSQPGRSGPTIRMI